MAPPINPRSPAPAPSCNTSFHHEPIQPIPALHFPWARLVITSLQFVCPLLLPLPLASSPYPSLVRFGMQGLQCEQVLRFLSKRPEVFQGEACSDCRRRKEGVRLKHWANSNSLKMYDKGSILRVETTINDPKDFKVFRAPEGKPDAPKGWFPLRRSTADTFRRADISRKATERYLGTLGCIKAGHPLGKQAEGICRPVHKSGKRYRALNPLAQADADLLHAICDGRFLMQGFRNADIRQLLYPAKVSSEREAKRRSNAITRRFALLRAHGIIAKVPRSHLYHVTSKGRRLIAGIEAAKHADTEQLIKMAA